MQIYTSDEVRAILLRDIPFLSNWDPPQVWLTDRVMAEIDPQQVGAISQSIEPEYKRIHGERWDCDDIARHAEDVAKLWWLELNVRAEALALGRAFTTEPHTTNIFIYRGRAHLYEFQTDQWSPAARDEHIYKVDL